MAATPSSAPPWVIAPMPTVATTATVNLILDVPISGEAVASVAVLPNGGAIFLLPESIPVSPWDTPMTQTRNNITLGYNANPLQVWLYRATLPPTPSPTSNAAGPTTSLASSGPSYPSSTTPANSSTPSESAAARGPTKSSTGVSNGAAAGIAIGCLLAGALITAILLWFCTGRKRRSKGNDYEATSTALVPREKGFNAQATSLGSGSPSVSPISGALPLPLEDKAITGEVSKISNSIKNHIQSYYHTNRVSPGVLDLDDIQAIGGDLPISVGMLNTLLGNTGTREIALRFCIAWVVCTRIQTSANPSVSFLPAELAALSRNIETTRPSSSAAVQWRVMTAQLLQSSYIHDSFTVSDSRNSSIQAALAALEAILQPYADSRMDNQERRHNLEEILKRAALFAFTLFSQPSEFGFDWKGAQNVKSGELCIFPALVQVSDEAGQPVAPPRPFSEAVVRRLEA